MNADSPHQQQRVSQSEQTICMEKIENLVKNYIAQHQLPSNENPILVAVSGGVDSVVLLHLLMALGYRCTVAHCNFHLRAEESDRDELFVRKLCASKNIPLFIHHFNTHYEANKRGISIEMAARELRYNWFELLRQDLNIQYIAVGHHRDDSVETLLLNLLRGTGIRGLTGITPIRDQIVRPLLSLTRQQIMEYALEHQLNFVEDSSNSDDVFFTQQNTFAIASADAGNLAVGKRVALQNVATSIVGGKNLPNVHTPNHQRYTGRQPHLHLSFGAVPRRRNHLIRGITSIGIQLSSNQTDIRKQKFSFGQSISVVHRAFGKRQGLLCTVAPANASRAGV